tara:strand:+ start:20269 stop:20622 length:354 start_codon:yes stop_codon:yes gene_type:complete
MIQYPFGPLVQPSKQWRAIAALEESTMRTLLIYPCLLAILPAFVWYYGTTKLGWIVGDHGETIRLTHESARQICILFYMTMLTCIVAITLPTGVITSREYAEREWPIDILITIVWMV